MNSPFFARPGVLYLPYHGVDLFDHYIRSLPVEGEFPAGVGGWTGVVYPDPITDLPIRVFSGVSFGGGANHDFLVVSHFLPRFFHHLRGAEVRVVLLWRRYH